MNEELLNILEKAYSLAIKTGEFVVQEGTILLQQFILWKTVEHALYVMLGLVFIIGIPLGIRSLYNEGDYAKFLGKQTDSDFDDFEYFGGACLVLVSVLVGLFIFFEHLFSFLKILIAPNVYLLEYFLK
jgi:hypothetical protein